MATVTLDWQLPLPMVAAPQKLPAEPGVYVLTLLRAGCYFAHYIGESSRLIERLAKHIDCYKHGRYWLHDLDETLRQDRLGRPLYSKNSIMFHAKMQSMANRWVAELHVFHAVMSANDPTPEEVEGAVGWAYHRDPEPSYTRFYDFCHRIVLNKSLDLVHSFEGPRIEGL